MYKLEKAHLIFNSRDSVGANETDFEGDLVVEPSKPQLSPPPMYKVVLINDDFTPMEFVVQVLETFFFMSKEQATTVMLTVHTQGKGVCGVFSRDVAETKSAQVMHFARKNEHPLLCQIEKVEG